MRRLLACLVVLGLLTVPSITVWHAPRRNSAVIENLGGFFVPRLIAVSHTEACGVGFPDANWQDTATGDLDDDGAGNCKGLSAGAPNHEFWIDTFTQAQYARATITSTNLYPAVSVLGTQIPQYNGYVCYGNGANVLAIYEVGGGTETQLATASRTWTTGSVMTLTVDASGNLACDIDGGTDVTATDTTFTSGSPGLSTYSDTALLDNWEGGDGTPGGGGGAACGNRISLLGVGC